MNFCTSAIPNWNTVLGAFSCPSTTFCCSDMISSLVPIGVAAAPIDCIMRMKTGLSMVRILSSLRSSGVRIGRLLLVKSRKPFSLMFSTRNPATLRISSAMARPNGPRSTSHATGADENRYGIANTCSFG